jgi:protein-S-isoprenylcysteine O-methyltransferase Ste14
MLSPSIEPKHIMETFRYLVALLLVTFVPAIFLYWLLLHALLPVWRRLGISAAQYLLWAAVVAVALLLFSWRDELLGKAYGFQPLLAAVGIVLLAGAVVFRLQIERHLPWRVQLGLPEIDPSGYPQRLVTEGPYAHTRHPRYMQVLLALAGWALLANYPAAYLAALLWVPFLLVIVRLEEPELRRRFGTEYADYEHRVARFWPQTPASNHRVKA